MASAACGSSISPSRPTVFAPPRIG
jgi:hypothetical protein